MRRQLEALRRCRIEEARAALVADFTRSAKRSHDAAQKRRRMRKPVAA